jgi:hypothetical protein
LRSAWSQIREAFGLDPQNVHDLSIDDIDDAPEHDRLDGPENDPGDETATAAHFMQGDFDDDPQTWRKVHDRLSKGRFSNDVKGMRPPTGR